MLIQAKEYTVFETSMEIYFINEYCGNLGLINLIVFIHALKLCSMPQVALNRKGAKSGQTGRNSYCSLQYESLNL